MQTNASDYYVYTYEDEDGEIYYVGKGRGKRACAHVIDDERDVVTIRVVARNLNNDDAIDLEAELIAENPNLSNIIRPAKYVLTGPDGEVHEVWNLSRFCRKHGLRIEPMYDVLSGTIRAYKGWRGKRVHS